MGNPEEDTKRLSLLSTFHYVFGSIVGFAISVVFVAGMVLFWRCGGFHFCLTGFQEEGSRPLAWFLLVVLFFFLLSTAFSWALAICIFKVARNLKRTMRYRFCLVMAYVESVIFALSGTGNGMSFFKGRMTVGEILFETVVLIIALCGVALGIYTIITLRKNSVRDAFKQNEAPTQ